jgi:ribosome production factor 2
MLQSPSFNCEALTNRLCSKSLLVFGSSSKKRPHTLTLARTFDYKVLDMLELSLDPESFRTMKQFKSSAARPGIGQRPMLLFAGTLFESPVSNEYTAAKSLLTDFFRGDSDAAKIDVEGLGHIICVSAAEPSGDGSNPAVRVRCYRIRTKRSGQKLPRVEVDELGPRMDFRLGRLREADPAVLKEALRRPKGAEEKTRKNISTDGMGDKLGRIHLGKQDLNGLQTRKMKALKRGREENGVGDEDIDGDRPKRARET